MLLSWLGFRPAAKNVLQPLVSNVTFAMMWKHGPHVLAAADGSVTFQGRGTSGPNPFGYRAEVPGHRVLDRALKLYAHDRGACLLAAGAEDSILRFAEAFREELDSGASPAQAIVLAGRRADSAQFGAFEVLVGFVDGVPQVLRWHSAAGEGLPQEIDGAVIGSAPDEMRAGLLRSAAAVPPDRPAIGTLLTLQAAVHLLLMQRLELTRSFLSGMLSGAVVSAGGISAAPDTLWVTTHHEAFDVPSGDSASVGLISSMIRENAHYVYSSHQADADAGVSIFFNDWAPETGEWLARWEAELDAAILAPQVVAFLHVTRRVAFLVGGLRGVGPAVVFKSHPLAIEFTPQAALAYREAMEDAEGAIQVRWFPGSPEGGTPGGPPGV